MKIIYKQPKNDTLFNRYGIENLCFKFLYMSEDIKNTTRKPHCHSQFEIHIIDNEYQIYECEGREYKTESGNMLIIPPGKTHRLKTSGEHTSKYAVTFGLKEDKYLSESDCLVMPIPDFILTNIHEIILEYKKRLYFSSQIIENSLFNITANTLRIIGCTEKNPEGDFEEDNRFLLAKQYILDNTERHLTVRDVALYCYMSTKQLTRIFKNTCGITPAQYIKRKKTECAERLINDGASFAEISERMNFSSQYHFNSFFKKYTGMTPGEYKKMQHCISLKD